MLLSPNSYKNCYDFNSIFNLSTKEKKEFFPILKKECKNVVENSINFPELTVLKAFIYLSVINYFNFVRTSLFTSTGLLYK